MILYYAVGGGLGHLTRARAVVHSLGLHDDIVFVSASPFGRDNRVLGGSHHISVPPGIASDLKVYREWLQDIIEAVGPRLMFIDAFPGGLIGEFCDFCFPRGLQLYHISRLLRWDRYKGRLKGEPPHYEMTFCVEPLTAEHREFLLRCSNDVTSLELIDPPEPESRQVRSLFEQVHEQGRKVWLVVHSAPDWETEELYRIAVAGARRGDEPAQIIIIAPPGLSGEQEGATHLSVYPAASLFSLADHVVTACGFNAMRQGCICGNRHIFHPFERSLDDQYLRAERQRRVFARNESAKGPLLDALHELRPSIDGQQKLA